MNILLLTTSYPRYKGDFRGIFVEKLVLSLKRLGNEVTVIKPRGFKHLTQNEGILPNLTKSWLARFQFPFYFLQLLWSILSNVKKCDIIHANWSLTGLAAILTRWLHHKKIILTVRSPFLVHSNNVLIRKGLGFILGKVDRAVTISDESKKILVKKFPSLKGRIMTINNGVDTEAFMPNDKDMLRKKLGLPSDKKIVLMVGRIIKVKGLDIAINAFQKVKQKSRDVMLVIVGDGGFREELERRVKGDKSIKFVGTVNHAELPKWMASADVLVMPSLKETGGNVILEALSSGLPVLSTRVGWVEKVVQPGKNGLFIEKNSEKSIEQQLLRVLKDPSLLRSLQKHARASVKGRSWKHCAKQYLTEYRAIS